MVNKKATNIKNIKISSTAATITAIIAEATDNATRKQCTSVVSTISCGSTSGVLVGVRLNRVKSKGKTSDFNTRVLSGTNKGFGKLAAAGITQVQALLVTVVPWMRVARRRRIEIIIVSVLRVFKARGVTNISSELQQQEIW